jgi:tripartite-type tricarboxylate transporter receptor subunit TctC
MKIALKPLLAYLAFALLSCAHAQTSWPTKTVRLINTFPAGGPSDILARALGETLQKQTGQTFIIENKPGASGNIGADFVAKSPADGSTLVVGIDTTFTMNPHIYKPMPFKVGNAAGDLRPLVIISSNGLLLGTSTQLGVKTLPEFIKLGQSKILNFSSGGNGSPGHLALEILRDASRVRIVHIPYRGNSPAVMAILSSEVDAGILSVSGMMPHVKAGKMTAIAMTSKQRSKALPDVPTVGELGMQNLEAEVLTVIYAPGNMPPAQFDAMQAAVLKGLADPAVQNRIKSLDMDYEGLTGEAANKRLAVLSAQYVKIAKSTGMKLD